LASPLCVVGILHRLGSVSGHGTKFCLEFRREQGERGGVAADRGNGQLEQATSLGAGRKGPAYDGALTQDPMLRSLAVGLPVAIHPADLETLIYHLAGRLQAVPPDESRPQDLVASDDAVERLPDRARFGAVQVQNAPHSELGPIRTRPPQVFLLRREP